MFIAFIFWSKIIVSKFAASDYDYLLTSLLGDTSLYYLPLIITSASALLLSYSEILIEFWDCFLFIGTESVLESRADYYLRADLVGCYLSKEAYFDFLKFDELFSSLDIVE